MEWISVKEIIMKTTEKKVSHTPGPWQIRYGSGIDMKIIAPDFGLVAEIKGPNTVEAMDEYEDVFRANAKLIAAAPELLFQVQQAKAILEVIDPENPAIAQMDAAIEKATE